MLDYFQNLINFSPLVVCSLKFTSLRDATNGETVRLFLLFYLPSQKKIKHWNLKKKPKKWTGPAGDTKPTFRRNRKRASLLVRWAHKG